MSSYRNNFNVLLGLPKSVKVPAEKTCSSSSYRVPESALALDQGDASTAEANDLSSIGLVLDKRSEIWKCEV